jgi:hypothetical protein
LLNLLGNRRYCDFDRTDFELSSMEKGWKFSGRNH